jgi:hypothetical protein
VVVELARTVKDEWQVAPSISLLGVWAEGDMPWRKIIKDLFAYFI